MKKLILLTFGFLGWAFYEMSGGDEFEPGQVSAFNNAPKLTVEPVQPAQPEAEPVVARAETSSADLTAVAVAAPSAAETKAAEVLAKGLTAKQAQADKAMEELVKAARAGLKTVPEELRGIEPSSAVSTEIVRYVPTGQAGAAQSDIRRITGNRVNMRNGPGTNHGVVAKLTKGDQVNVLRDNGDGWLKVRVVDSGRIGWTADFLVTAAN